VPLTSLRRGVHVVDDFGLVGCPRQRRDVAVGTCLTCRALLETTTDAAGTVVEIRCSVPVDTSPPPRWPWLLGWDAVRRL
jgi:hypothetical protein